MYNQTLHISFPAYSYAGFLLLHPARKWFTLKRKCHWPICHVCHLNSQKIFVSMETLKKDQFGLFGNRTNSQKLVPIICGYRWPGWKWIATSKIWPIFFLPVHSKIPKNCFNSPSEKSFQIFLRCSKSNFIGRKEVLILVKYLCSFDQNAAKWSWQY